jgi:hypothetical protein
MAKDIPVTLDLSPDVLLALGRAAERCGRRPGDHLALLLRSALEMSCPTRGRRDEEVHCALATAHDWPNLQHRLRALGYVLRLGADSELRLCSWPRERPILPLSVFGTSREALAMRFGRDFPPHSASEACWRKSPVPAFRSGRAA